MLRNGHLEYKNGFCAACGTQFQFPAHLKPRPVYCDEHDPVEIPKIDLSQFDKMYEAPVAKQVVTGISIHGSPSSPTQAQGVGTWDSINVPAFAIPQQIVTPVGNKFSDSQAMKSIDQIRSEYIARISQVQAPESTVIHLPSPKKGHIIGINHMGDIHIGTDACTYIAFKQMLEWILNTDDEYLAIQGDMVDVLTAHSVGVMAEQSMSIHDQFMLAMADLIPLAKAGKILWTLRGNHEERLDKATKNIVDAMQQMSRMLDVRYLGWQGYVQIECNGVSYLSYNTHGFSAGRRPGSRRNKMEDMLHRHPTVDVITCGHNHHLDIIPVEAEEFRDGRPWVRTRFGVYTGTYHSYMGYAAEAGLGAGPLGCARLRFDVSDGNIAPELVRVVREGTGYKHKLPIT